MKIGELNWHCGECSVIEYCAEPFEDLCLCMDSRLEDVDEKDYIRLAEQSTKSNNEDICEDVISRLNYKLHGGKSNEQHLSKVP